MMRIWHALQSDVNLLAREGEVSIGRRSVAEEAPRHHAIWQYLNDGTCHEGHGDGKANAASHIALCFSRCDISPDCLCCSYGYAMLPRATREFYMAGVVIWCSFKLYFSNSLHAVVGAYHPLRALVDVADDEGRVS